MVEVGVVCKIDIIPIIFIDHNLFQLCVSLHV